MNEDLKTKIEKILISNGVSEYGIIKFFNHLDSLSDIIEVHKRSVRWDARTAREKHGQAIKDAAKRKKSSDVFHITPEGYSEFDIIGWQALCDFTGLKESTLRFLFASSANIFTRNIVINHKTYSATIEYTTVRKKIGK